MPRSKRPLSRSSLSSALTKTITSKNLSHSHILESMYIYTIPIQTKQTGCTGMSIVAATDILYTTCCNQPPLAYFITCTLLLGGNSIKNVDIRQIHCTAAFFVVRHVYAFECLSFVTACFAIPEMRLLRVIFALDIVKEFRGRLRDIACENKLACCRTGTGWSCC